MNNQGYILLVEDNARVQDNNRQMLERHGYSVRLAMNLTQAREAISERMPAAVVLDIMLPDGNGICFLKELRQISNIPVLLLTAIGTSKATIAGLEAGGDDYLRKPYNLAEFRARVDALMRRASHVPETMEKGSLTLDIAAGAAYLNNEDLLLSKKEFSLLFQFMRHEGKSMSAEYLYEKAWGQPMNDDTQAIRTSVSRLRKKLENGGYTIEFSRNEGYSFTHGKKVL